MIRACILAAAFAAGMAAIAPAQAAFELGNGLRTYNGLTSQNGLRTSNGVTQVNGTISANGLATQPQQPVVVGITLPEGFRLPSLAR